MNLFPEKQQYACFPLGDIVPAKWMQQQMKGDLRHGFAGCLDELSPRVSSHAFACGRVKSFEKTPAGMIHDTPRTWWNGESEAVWLDGFVRMAYLSGDRRAIKKADKLMSDLLESQDESGYIGIYTADCRYQHRKENGEFWTQSRALLAMLAYYEISGKKEYLEGVKKAIRLTMRHYGPDHSYFNNETPAGGTGHGLMLVDVLEWLFLLTNDETYRDYGIWCYRDYCSAKNIRDVDNQLDRLLRLDEGFNWHTPHTTEHLRVPLWVYYMTGDSHYKQAAENSFTKIQRYLVPSGACIGDELILDRQPTADMLYEYCAITELLVSMQSAYQKTGMATWADKVEWLAFNAAQGARLPDGKAISYLTKDNRDNATGKEHQGKTKLSPTHEDSAVCCNPNAVKLLPYYTSKMWLRLPDDTGVCAFCYGPSELHTRIGGIAITIREETDYPFSEELFFHILPEEPVEFELRLRIPVWASGFDIDAAGALVTNEEGFCRIRKLWKQGDCVRISFQCSVQPLIASNGEVAIQRGPLLYAFPIPETRKILREYDVAGLVDISAEAKKPAQTFLVDLDDCDFRLEKNDKAKYSHPWHASPVVLTGFLHNSKGDKCPTTLVPFGCTLLRQATFSQYRNVQKIG